MKEWLTEERDFDGAPLHLKLRLGVDWKTLESACSELLTITHTLSRRQPNGLPETQDIELMSTIDLAIQNTFENSTNAAMVLIETYGGKRNFYCYVSKDFPIADEVASISRQFPGESITNLQQPDPRWLFIEQYSAEFFPQHVFPRRSN